MSASVIHISTAAITCIQDVDYDVKIITGAPQQLVTHRELRHKYETNRSIKTWAVYFLLKRISPNSGQIINWQQQLDVLLPFLQINEKTFRARLAELISLQLASLENNGTRISLVSYEKAAGILGIEYTGTYTVQYNPLKKTKRNTHAKQSFQYLLRTEEFRHEQRRQLDAMTYYLDQNPSLKNDLHYMLTKEGAEHMRLKEPAYFQQRLLLLQMRLFREGSDLLAYVMERRADINRSVTAIKEDHRYKSKQSATYCKRQMWLNGYVDIKKKCIESKVRSRLYYDDAGVKKDGYKWIAQKKTTAWFLCDQVQFNYTSTYEPAQRTTRKAA